MPGVGTQKGIDMFVKWIFDRLAALFGLVCLFWLFPIVAVLIKVKMPGPVFYRQKRVGKNGRLFTMVKFRTMTVGQDASSVSVAGQSRITFAGETI